MGLDMYLGKVRKLRENATLNELRVVNEYYDFKERDPKYKKISMKRWCGIDYKEVNRNLAKLYLPEYIHRYSEWDAKHEYGFKSIFQNVIYWRKANQIHKWFVENVQGGNDDCGNYIVTKEQLMELLGLCKGIKAFPKLAKTLLPTESGFFFGSTEYDEWYMKDIEHTIKGIERVLSETDFDNWIVFYSSSW